MKPDTKIKHIIRYLSGGYALFWLIPVLLTVFCEKSALLTGLYADDPQAGYILNTIGILAMMGCTYGALKLFAVWKRRIPTGTVTSEEAVARYVKLTIGQWAVLEFAAIVNILAADMTQNNLFFCIVIPLIASFFCRPSEQRLRADLGLDTESAGITG